MRNSTIVDDYIMMYNGYEIICNYMELYGYRELIFMTSLLNYLYLIIEGFLTCV